MVQEQDHRAPGWEEKRTFKMGFGLGSPLPLSVLLFISVSKKFASKVVSGTAHI